MLPEWASVLVAKAKVAGLLAAAVAAGGVGGAVALSHVAPVSQQIVNDASTSPSADPESADAQDPETTTLPAYAAIGIITLFVLLSISGYLILSAS